MRRLLVTGLSSAGLFFAVGLIGCGGGPDEGMPADTKPAISLEDMKSKSQMVPYSKISKTAAPAPDAKTETPK